MQQKLALVIKLEKQQQQVKSSDILYNMSANDEGSDDLNVEEQKRAIENDLSIGILQILKPAVEQVDRRVLDVRYEYLLNFCASSCQFLSNLLKSVIVANIENRY